MRHHLAALTWTARRTLDSVLLGQANAPRKEERLSQDAKLYLMNVITNPDLKLQERKVALNMGNEKEKRIRIELLMKGFVKELSMKGRGRGSSYKQLKATAKGEKYLGIMEDSDAKG